jgi:hypothetical protein
MLVSLIDTYACITNRYSLHITPKIHATSNSMKAVQELEKLRVVYAVANVG